MIRKKSKYNVAVVGVGAVGIEMLRVLKQRNFPVDKLRVFARSPRKIEVDGIGYDVESVSAEGFAGIDIALFAGTEGEKGAAVTFAPEAVRRGAMVIDNGADFRLEPDVPLVVPEVNPQDAKKAKRGIIANPNCSTIQMVVALWPIHKKIAKIKKVIVSTYQAASGAGALAVEQLKEETVSLLASWPVVKFNRQTGKPANRQTILPQQIAFNVFPHIGSFSDDGYTTEEWKMIKETHKIMHDDKIKISATTVRVPVRTGHSEAVYLETAKPIDIDRVKAVLAASNGITLIDDVKTSRYPLAINAEGRDEVFVGRVRRDPFNKKGLWLWIVADNLRKGAATNAVQIAELFLAKY